ATQEFGSGNNHTPHPVSHIHAQPNHNIRHHKTREETLRTNKRKKTRANILLATLNMRGRASPQLGNSNISKWTTIQHIMREKKIGILCVQEAHLLPEHETQIDTLYTRRLKVVNSRDPHQPGNSAGVAIIINKEIVNPNELTITEITPGRVLVIKINGTMKKDLTIANIYAPNNHTQHAEFWNKIADTWQEKRLPNPDFVMGDFNTVAQKTVRM
ncbi:hypothetical protein DFJ58DRAFT_645327, partial [Suillus subalutaceus]|uniref:uncharacterized protein n=1 Tax=Suillus subalutaceus TaxID=48586 RepID=UPI001B870CD0